MVFRKIIDFLFSTPKRKVMFFSSLFVLIVMSIILLYMFLFSTPKNDDYTKTDTSGLYDNGGQLLDIVGIDIFAAITNKLSDFLASQNLDRSEKINIVAIKMQPRDSQNGEFTMSIPSLSNSNILVKLNYDYDTAQQIMTIPDYQYRAILYEAPSYGDM